MNPIAPSGGQTLAALSAAGTVSAGGDPPPSSGSPIGTNPVTPVVQPHAGMQSVGSHPPFTANPVHGVGA